MQHKNEENETEMLTTITEFTDLSDLWLVPVENLR